MFAHIHNLVVHVVAHIRELVTQFVAQADKLDLDAIEFSFHTVDIGLVAQHVVFQPEDVQLDRVSLIDWSRAKDEEVSKSDEIDL